MTTKNYTTFATKIGRCGIAWRSQENTGEIIITNFQLPESDIKKTNEKTFQITGGLLVKKTPAKILQIINRIQKHLRGNSDDFQNILCDTETASEFALQVYSACRLITPGKTIAYGKLAEMIKRPNSSRAVGMALGKNPIPLIIPCHRVIQSGGGLGGFSASGGIQMKENNAIFFISS